MTSSQKIYDAVVVGTGQGGKPLAIALAKSGKKTAIIERADVGGTCVNVGCTPTKTMIACARVAYLARRGKEYGVETDVKIDLKKVREVKRDIVKSFREGSEKAIEKTAKLDLIRGEASFTGPEDLEVKLNASDEVMQLRAEQIFLNTGSRPRELDFEGLSDVDYLHSETITELDKVPEHLIIVGGGYIGIEFAQMFCRFGSKVTMVSRSDLLTGREDPDIIETLEKILTEDGIRLLTKTNTKRVVKSDKQIVLTVDKKKDGEQEIAGSHLLIAAGRVPNSDALNCDAAGIKVDDRGHIKVNERLETNIPNIWALGDVVDGPSFTHIAYDDYRIIERNVIKGGNASTSGRIVPYCLFTDPELGRVGLTEQQAKKQGYNYKVAKMPASHVARALEMNEPRGLLKVVIDGDNDQILGCSILSVMGGELMGVIEMAMLGNVPYTRIRDGVLAHPTLTESLNNLFSTVK